MKVVYLSYTYWPPDFGGELLISIERFESLVQRGFSVVILTSGRTGYESYEVRGGIEIYRSPTVHSNRVGRIFRRLIYVLWATLHLLRFQPDVVHYGIIPGLNRTTQHLAGLWFGFICHVKRLRTVYVHSLMESDTNSFNFTGITGLLQSRFVKSINTVVSISPRIHADIEKAFPGATIVQLPCGVRDDVFVPLHPREITRVRGELGLFDTDVLFSFLGSVGHRKGFDVLAEAFSEISKKYPNWYLLVLGPKDKAENNNIIDQEVAAVTAEVSQNTNAIFTGRINDRERLAQLLGASDVFVFPSRREGMGIAPLEAMSAGVPPVIARIPGITDQANIHEQTGLYVDVGNVTELKQAMIRLGTDQLLRRQYGNAARQRIEQNFSWEQYIDQWEALYMSVARNKASKQTCHLTH